MQITSVDLGDSESVITAEGNMGEYGRVYASYHLSYNQDGTGGTYTAREEVMSTRTQWLRVLL